ncbi:MAG: response regulator [Gammaproteobacteria bacterium]|nr:MAG: response regulator [Gammaproteobacteria bacterium]
MHETDLKQNETGLQDSINRVLVVEDSATERFRIAALLAKLGYEVIQTENGQEAMEWLKGNRAAIVLSDWSMPVMTGLELCRWVKQEAFGDPYFILVTGRDTTSDLVAGMEAGADDFIAKPFNREELRVRLIAGQRMMKRMMKMRQSLERQNLELQQYIEREARAAEQTKQDLAMASEMLVDLLPGDVTLTPSMNITGVFKPAAAIGGDFYNFFKLDEQHIGFYLLDVAGHGIPSALLSFTLARTILPTPRNESILFDQAGVRSPSSVVSELNKRFVSHISSGQYFTIIYGVIDVASGNGKICQAAHPHPFMISTDGTTDTLGDGGLPVGILPDADYEDTLFHLPEGGRLVVFSDGITECENPENKPFGTERFMNIMAARRLEPLQQATDLAFQEVLEWQANGEQNDDMTFIALERT